MHKKIEKTLQNTEELKKMSKQQLENQRKMLQQLTEIQNYLVEFSDRTEKNFRKLEELAAALALRTDFQNLYSSYVTVSEGSTEIASRKQAF